MDEERTLKIKLKNKPPINFRANNFIENKQIKIYRQMSLFNNKDSFGSYNNLVESSKQKNYSRPYSQTDKVLNDDNLKQTGIIYKKVINDQLIRKGSNNSKSECNINSPFNFLKIEDKEIKEKRLNEKEDLHFKITSILTSYCKEKIDKQDLIWFIKQPIPLKKEFKLRVTNLYKMYKYKNDNRNPYSLGDDTLLNKNFKLIYDYYFISKKNKLYLLDIISTNKVLLIAKKVYNKYSLYLCNEVIDFILLDLKFNGFKDTDSNLKKIIDSYAFIKYSSLSNDKISEGKNDEKFNQYLSNKSNSDLVIKEKIELSEIAYIKSNMMKLKYQIFDTNNIQIAKVKYNLISKSSSLTIEAPKNVSYDILDQYSFNKSKLKVHKYKSYLYKKKSS